MINTSLIPRLLFSYSAVSRDLSIWEQSAGRLNRIFPTINVSGHLLFEARAMAKTNRRFR
jgi:hypothetical protein